MRRRAEAGDLDGGEEVTDEDDPPLRGRRVGLRQPRGHDIREVTELLMSPGIGFRFLFRGTTPGPDDGAYWLSQGIAAQYVVYDLRTDSMVGLVRAYALDSMAGHARVSVVTVPEVHGLGAGFEGLALFANLLFTRSGLRKLYAETPAYNYEPFKGGAGRFFEIEAVLKEHRYFGGRFWDSYLMSLTRDRWTDIWNRFNRGIATPDGTKGSAGLS